MIERGTHDRSVPDDVGLKLIDLKVCAVELSAMLSLTYFATEKGVSAPRENKA